MSLFREISSEEINKNFIKLLKRDNMLITVSNDEKVNMMTASWGGFGEMWGEDVSFAVIRPSRYTYNMIENTNKYTLCFFGGKYRDVLSFCGKKSGRDCDKVNETGLTVEQNDGFSYFSEADLVICCEKMYTQDFKRDNFNNEVDGKSIYPTDDIHKLYIGKICKVLEK